MVCPIFRIGTARVRTVAVAARFDQAADRFFRDSAATATLDSHPSPPLK